jgi:hypothetical protein
MRILSVAAIAICLTGPAWADQTSAAPAPGAEPAVATSEVDADQIQRTMESIFEQAFAAAAAAGESEASANEVQVAERS